MKKFVLTITVILLLSIIFWSGTKTGRYLSGVERENLYPFELRSVWVSNQPTCDDYNSLSNAGKAILVDIVKDSKNRSYVRIVSLPTEAQKGKFMVSVLNRNQEQFIDEIWLDCE